jgi:hypothetical protein
MNFPRLAHSALRELYTSCRGRTMNRQEFTSPALHPLRHPDDKPSAFRPLDLFSGGDRCVTIVHCCMKLSCTARRDLRGAHIALKEMGINPRCQYEEISVDPHLDTLRFSTSDTGEAGYIYVQLWNLAFVSRYDSSAYKPSLFPIRQVLDMKLRSLTLCIWATQIRRHVARATIGA